MNQILSVDKPKNNSRTNGTGSISSKSVTIFFSIFLIIFGICLIGVSIYSIVNNKSKTISSVQPDSPRIDVTQNATELEIEVTCTSEISKIEYNWEGQETKNINSNGRKNMNLKVDIPSGTNIFSMVVTDADGRTNQYKQEYVGAKEPNIVTFNPNQIENKIIVVCEENQIIKYMAYNYDDQAEKQIEINNTTGRIEIDSLQGEHDLTIKVGYEDGTVGKSTNKVYAPTVSVGTNGANGHYNKFIINASDVKNIKKVIINFNGEEKEEQVNSKTYSKEIDLQPGEPGTNKLKVTVYNENDMSYTSKVWDKSRQQ